MDETSFDIAMKFVAKGKQTVWAESTLSVHPGDPLMKDFKPISSYDDYSNFFEVQSFDFSMSVDPEDAGGAQGGRTGAGARGGRGNAQQARSGTQRPGQNGNRNGGRTNGDEEHDSSDPWIRWRSASTAEARRMHHPLTFDSFRFTRIIDGASPSFFQACCRQERFDSAALVKRVSTGLRGGAERQSFAFMRIDFTEVLFKGVKWSDGDLVTESCEFVCNTLKYQYRQQMRDGGLRAPQSPAEWNRKTDAERRREGEG